MLAPSVSAETPAKSLGMVTVTSGQPTSLPTQIPTTIEGVTREQIEQTINATDSEDALKYLPSLLVRKRYIGDYNHAVLSTRASGTGNPARSMVYADGILLSNYLGNGPTNAPRWGLVTPEEIERVDVLYGPFSAAYPGNSVGAVVDYVTRMPTKFEAHAKLSAFSQNFRLYGTDSAYGGTQASASLGNRSGDWSWFINANRTQSSGQPLTFVTKTLASGVAPTAGVPVTGAVAGKNRTNDDHYILGAGTQYDTLQQHLKIKVAYDFSPTVRASYTLGLWDNTSQGRSESYLRDAAGNPVYRGNVVINNRQFALSDTDFNVSNEKLQHQMHGLSVKSHTQGQWDWELAGSLYDYGSDILRAATVAQPAALNGGAGRIVDQQGTGWNTLALKGTWRPQGMSGAHIVDVGVQRDSYQLRSIENATANWINGSPGARNLAVRGDTLLSSVYAQDTWKFAPGWKAVLGARVENWKAFNGFTAGSTSTLAYAERQETTVSPKAALAYQWTETTVLKASTGRAVRNPTVGELYGITTGTLATANNPNLKAEKSWTTELSAERDIGKGLLRTTLFFERTHDALYSQLANPALVQSATNPATVQNVDQVNTQGIEVAYQASDVFFRGFDLGSSLTWTDSKITKNTNFPASVGKWQPRIPEWRASLLMSYKPDATWAYTLGVRYSGKQYGTLDNSDVNGFAYMGSSKYFVTDVRLHYKVGKQWTAAVGIDNLNNYSYWNFHPYPQRTFMAELKVQL